MNRFVVATALGLALLGCQSTPKQFSPVAKDAPAAPTAASTTAAVSGEAAAPLISDRRQLTFAGRRSGEGYFSHDGRYMIFQSEREAENPFYQMYVMDLKSGATHRVSPGNGKTTCGWIHPNGKQVLFSSTHADPNWKKKAEQEWNDRKNPKSRYSWNFDDTYDIYQADINGGNLKNLTHTKGYNAEGSYSPDGKWIAFASNRAAYDGSMNDEDAKHFAQDPSYMMDIYLMRADGSDVKRLTSEPGYDGGPFFSPNGKRIVYRHFAPDGRTAEVYSMNVDGSDHKQLTHLGAMSWAPFYHPSGDYLIFSSNKFGPGNFELFITDTEGRHDPIRVTDLEGFDGLPVFSPDGQNLVWAHSNPHAEAQLFRAAWNDALARQLLQLPPTAPTGADVRRWVEYLADPYFGGRPTGGAHEKEYAGAIAENFKKLGLQPAGDSFVQAYTFTSGLELGEGNHLHLHLGTTDTTLLPNADWVPLSFSKVGSFASAPVVFAGYGIVAPASGAQPAYDSYQDLDVKNKWVAVFSGLPNDVGNERRFYLHLYSQMQSKAMVARQRGALGLILMEDTIAPAPNMKIRFEGRNEDAGLPVIRLSNESADRLFSAALTTRQQWTEQLAKGVVTPMPVPPVSLQADVDMHFKKSEAHNVVALLKVPGATGTVIVGAHLDHLGHGEQGNSMVPGNHEIHPGADDNASGVAGVMALAKELTERSRSGAVRLRQNVLFALWTGEEIGLLGSTQWVGANKRYKLTASVNMDMIGRYREQLLVQGLGSAPQWKSVIEQVAVANQTPLNLQTQDDPYLPSDALTFYMAKIPSIMLFTGSHAQYHTPEDKASWINFDGLTKVAAFGERVTEALASPYVPPVSYVKVESAPQPHGHSERGLRLYLGTIPDYSRELKHGVAITGTSKDSPADKAGLLPGDVILELGGMKIENLHDYAYCLQALKANEKTNLRILRAGQEKQLQITPQAKVQ